MLPGTTGAGSDGRTRARGRLTLVPGVAADPGAVSTGPRVGLRGAPERPWRFWLTGEPSVSTYRPASRRDGRRDPSTPSGPVEDSDDPTQEP